MSSGWRSCKVCELWSDLTNFTQLTTTLSLFMPQLQMQSRHPDPLYSLLGALVPGYYCLHGSTPDKAVQTKQSWTWELCTGTCETYHSEADIKQAGIIHQEKSGNEAIINKRRGKYFKNKTGNKERMTKMKMKLWGAGQDMTVCTWWHYVNREGIENDDAFAWLLINENHKTTLT